MATEFFLKLWDNHIIQLGVWQTVYMTFLTSLFAYVIGLPLGVVLWVTDKDGLHPNKGVNTVLGFIVNFFRSIPAVILMVAMIPAAKLLLGTSTGNGAVIVTLIIAAAPYVARMVESAAYNTELKPGGGWDMWRKIAAQDPSFGHPDKFCSDPEQTNWMSATVETLDQRIIPYIKNICKRDPFTGKVVTGGIVTVKDSSWLMSWTINRQPQFREQPKDHCLVWVYSLFTDKPGDYVKKPMRECTGKEICMEWLYHIGVPVDEIEDMAEHSANTVPVMMPYIDAFFMPRAYGDRPKVVPDGAVNFAFLGQFAETPRDTIFTTEYSMRTGMEAVYTLLNVDRGVPEVWGSVYDVRDLLNATVKLRDGKKVTDMDASLLEKLAFKALMGKIAGTDIEKLLKEHNVI